MIDFSLLNLRPMLFGSLAFLSYGALPMSAHARDFETAAPGPEAVDAALSTEGKPLLAATVLVAAALLGMERFCSWRLGGRQRQANGPQPTLAECLPPVAGLASRFSPAPES